MMIMMSTTASSEVIQTAPSSDGTYEAYILCVDTGATGVTHMYMSKRKKTTAFLSRKIKIFNPSSMAKHMIWYGLTTTPSR